MPGAQRVLVSLQQNLTGVTSSNCFPSAMEPERQMNKQSQKGVVRTYLEQLFPRFILTRLDSEVSTAIESSTATKPFSRLHSSNFHGIAEDDEKALSVRRPLQVGDAPTPPTLSPSKELYEAMKDVVEGGRRVRHAATQHDHESRMLGTWQRELQTEYDALEEDRDILAQRAVKQPRRKFFALMGQIDDRLKEFEQNEDDMAAAFERSRQPLIDQQAAQATLCERLSILLDEALPKCPGKGETEEPTLKDLERPFEGRLLEGHANLLKKFEGIFDLESRTVEVQQEAVEGWSSLLGPREVIQYEVQRAYESHKESIKNAWEWRDHEREITEEQFLKDLPTGIDSYYGCSPETKSTFDARMENIDGTRQNVVKLQKAELEVAVRRAAFCGLRINQQGELLDEDSEDDYVDPSQESAKQVSMDGWAAAVEGSGEVVAWPPQDGWDERQVPTNDWSEVDDWEWREMEVGESLSYIDEEDDYQHNDDQDNDDQDNHDQQSERSIIEDEANLGSEESDSDIEEPPDHDEDPELEPSAGLPDSEADEQAAQPSVPHDDSSEDDASEDSYLTGDNAFVRGLLDRQQANDRRANGQRKMRAR